jgi:hypothetical protein
MPKSKLLNETLTACDEVFVESYYDLHSPIAGNGTKCVLKAYPDSEFTYMTAANKANGLLKTPKIIQAGRELIESQGFNDENIDRETLKIIEQDKDLTNKRAAIDMANKLKGRYEKDNSQKAANIIVTIEEEE